MSNYKSIAQHQLATRSGVRCMLSLAVNTVVPVSGRAAVMGERSKLGQASQDPIENGKREHAKILPVDTIGVDPLPRYGALAHKGHLVLKFRNEPQTKPCTLSLEVPYRLKILRLSFGKERVLQRRSARALLATSLSELAGAPDTSAALV